MDTMRNKFSEDKKTKKNQHQKKKDQSKSIQYAPISHDSALLNMQSEKKSDYPKLDPLHFISRHLLSEEKYPSGWCC